MNTFNRIIDDCVAKTIFSCLILFSSLFVFSFYAISADVPKRADNVAVNNGFAKSYEEIKQKVKDKKILSLDLLAYARNFKLYSEMPSIEEATNIKRDFFKKSADYLKKLSDYKTIVEVYEENDKKDDPKYIEAKKMYDPLLKEFEKYFNEPPKVKGGR